MTLANEILGFSAEIVEHLRQRGETISTAESLTAGAVSSAIVTISGASDVFVGGVTAYRDEIKVSHLGIDPDLIEKYTVISEEVGLKPVALPEMKEKTREKLDRMQRKAAKPVGRGERPARTLRPAHGGGDSASRPSARREGAEGAPRAPRPQGTGENAERGSRTPRPAGRSPRPWGWRPTSRCRRRSR